MQPKIIPTPLFLPEGLWPKELKNPKVKGIAIDACVDPYLRRPTLDDGKAIAHAHCHPLDPYIGWICYKSDKYITRATNLHELAHLMAGAKAWHGIKWYKQFVELGNTSLYNKVVVFWDLFTQLSDKTAWKWCYSVILRFIFLFTVIIMFKMPEILSGLCMIVYLWSVIVFTKNVIVLEYSNA